MHHKYEKMGLVVVSVSTDPIVFKDDETKTLAKMTDEVKGFVAARKAPFDTLMLDEPFEVQTGKLHFDAPPAVFIFNRQGKWVKLIPEEENPPDKELKIYNGRIEKKVVEFLNEK
jgi:hypothetical protein